MHAIDSSTRVRHRIESALVNGRQRPSRFSARTIRGARRAARWLHTRSSNRTDKTCRRPQKTAKERIDVEAEQQQQKPGGRRRPARPASPFGVFGAAGFEGSSFSSSAVERRKLRCGRRAARMNHHVPSRGNLLSVQSHNFAQPPPDAIAPHRPAQRLLDAPAEPAAFEAIGAKKNGELAARPPPPVAIHRVVFRAVHQPAAPRKSSRGASDAREAVTPFLAAFCKNFSSTLALHPCAESVLLVAGAHMRLIRTFRQRSLSSGCAFLASVRVSVGNETISVCERSSTVKATRPDCQSAVHAPWCYTCAPRFSRLLPAPGI